MFNLPILESFLDKEVIAGYTWGNILEYWWIGLIIIIVAAVGLVGSFVLLKLVFGKMKFKEGDQEAFDNYKNAPKEEKKAVAKAAKGPVKNVIIWTRIKVWLIPVVCVAALIMAPVASFLPTAAFANLMFTLRGSHVDIYDTETSRQAAAEAEKNVVVIQEEGTVLLKNKDKTLPLNLETNKKINIFGSCAYGLFFNNGGSGAFQTDGRVSNFPRTAVKLEEALQEEGFEINDNLFNLVKNYYNGKKVSVAHSDHEIFCGINTFGYPEIVPSGNGAKLDPVDYELPVSAYETAFSELGGKTALEDAKEFSDTAIFAITRHGTESADMKEAELKLYSAEVAAIDMLEQNFDKVIILLNVPTVVESEFLDDDEISAALYIGHPGLTGTKAIAEILSGKVNPSGHLVDTWPYSVKSAPSYQCFGNDSTLTYTSGAANRAKFTNYVEGIYVGYRYYVTRGMTDRDAGYIYEDEVQYSFGHGLSYTTFDKSIVEYKVDKANQKVEVTVEIKNTGEVAGKDVIQLYTHAPYTPGGVEKSWYSLTTFQKTNIIEPGESKNYKLEFSFRDIASWSTEKGHYVLEKGDYEFSIRENVWDLAQTAVSGRENTKNMNLAEDVDFLTSYQTGKEYENIFQDVEYGGGVEPNTYLSRNDFAGTWQNKADIPLASNSDKNHFPGGASNSTGSGSFTFEDNQIDEEVKEQEVAGDLTLRDLKDAAWDDPRWEDLLSQLSYADMDKLIEYGGFQTASVDSIEKTQTLDYDGPSAAFHSGTGHPSEVIVGCSWSTDVARVMGESIGREGAARGLTGWYAPGINTHRSPFGGRNFEYYSEDPLISGLMAGHTAQGMAKYGVYTYAKHFFCNDQENSRAGVFVWATEQALREIYARGFELYVDLGGIGIMSAYNCIGSWWCGGSKAALTTLLREEWGFHGVVVTDYAGSDYMATNIGLRAGNDMWLTPSQLSSSLKPSRVRTQCPHDGAIIARRAAKNILFACAHSNNVWTLEDYAAVGIPEIKKAGDGHQSIIN